MRRTPRRPMRGSLGPGRPRCSPRSRGRWPSARKCPGPRRTRARSARRRCRARAAARGRGGAGRARRRGRRRASAGRSRRRRARARRSASSVSGAGGVRQLGQHELDGRRGDPARGRRRACRRPCRRGTASCRRRPGPRRPRRRPCTRGTRRTAPGARRSRASARRRRPLGPLEDRRAGRHLDRRAVDLEPGHASPSSSGKCASRLRIGAGMPPPCAHSEPSSSVSSSASSLARSTGAPPANISYARRRPIRHGKHLPQLSSAPKCSRCVGQRAHVGRLVERDDPAVAEHAADRREVVELKARVEQRRRQDPAERPADLQRLDRRGRRAARRRSPRTARRIIIPNGTS